MSKPVGAQEHVASLEARMNGYRLRARLLETILCCKEIELAAWRTGIDAARVRGALTGGMAVDNDGRVTGAEEALRRHLQEHSK